MYPRRASASGGSSSRVGRGSPFLSVGFSRSPARTCTQTGGAARARPSAAATNPTSNVGAIARAAAAARAAVHSARGTAGSAWLLSRRSAHGHGRPAAQPPSSFP